MLEFNHVTKIYDSNIVAVNDVSFTIKDGEFVFLIGASGSGKTTVIKMLIRDEVPTSGSVYFHERDITKISRSRVYKVRREIGVIFQDYKLIQDKTAYENVAFAMEVAGKKNKEIKETIPYVLDIVGLAHRASSFPRQLSGGEQQRIAIARAIANSPKILIADEPTGNLDPSSAWDIVQILNKINNWGTTVIMSTHGTDIVNSLNKRVIQMEGGKIIRDDNKGQYELAAKKEFEKKMNDNAEEVVGKKEKKKIKISMAPVEETSVAEAVEDTLHPKQKRGIFRLFSRKTETTEPVNVLAGILGEKTENTMQENADLNLNIMPQDQFDTETEENKNESEVVEETKKEPEKKKRTKKVRPLSMDSSEETVEQPEVKSEEATSDIKSNSLDSLQLDTELIELLKNAGYNSVDEIINDGVDTLSSKLDLSKRELQKIAKAVKKSAEQNV
jgi:cell division transport system ATP-binding protein